MGRCLEIVDGNVEAMSFAHPVEKLAVEENISDVCVVPSYH